MAAQSSSVRQPVLRSRTVREQPGNARDQSQGDPRTMSIAITEDHRALADTAVGLPPEARRPGRRPGAARGADRGAARRSGSDLVDLGWLGLHLPEEHGGSGYGLEELVVVVEELGRAVAPGPFVPTVIASAVLVAAGDDATKAKLLPGLADGSRHRRGGARAATVTVARRHGLRLGRHGARRRAGPRPARRRRATTSPSSRWATASPSTCPPNLDPTRRSRRVTLDGAAGDRPPRRAPQALVDLARVILVGRGRRPRPRVHRAGRRLRQGAPPVRPGRSARTRR